MKCAVFLGPSLPAESRPQWEGFVYLSPAARGDLECTSHEYSSIVFIDGVFRESLAVTPREMFQACRVAQVFGAASMGALRAVECAPYGAGPLGVIARWYYKETLDGDDEVAVAVNPKTQRAISVPSVNVRFAARLAVRQRILTQKDAWRWLAASRNIFYEDRSWNNVLELAPPHQRAALARLVQFSDLKALDARFALRCVMRRMNRRPN